MGSLKGKKNSVLSGEFLFFFWQFPVFNEEFSYRYISGLPFVVGVDMKIINIIIISWICMIISPATEPLSLYINALPKKRTSEDKLGNIPTKFLRIVLFLLSIVYQDPLPTIRLFGMAIKPILQNLLVIVEAIMVLREWTGHPILLISTLSRMCGHFLNTISGKGWETLISVLAMSRS
jgi:hypothetical protein